MLLIKMQLTYITCFTFSALTLLVGPHGRQKQHSACKNEKFGFKNATNVLDT